jgi:hypothetical protein
MTPRAGDRQIKPSSDDRCALYGSMDLADGAASEFHYHDGIAVMTSPLLSFLLCRSRLWTVDLDDYWSTSYCSTCK